MFGGDVGGGVPESGDLFLKCFFCFLVWFSVEFGGSLRFHGASSFDPEFGDHQSVIGIQSS